MAICAGTPEAAAWAVSSRREGLLWQPHMCINYCCIKSISCQLLWHVVQQHHGGAACYRKRCRCIRVCPPVDAVLCKEKGSGHVSSESIITDLTDWLTASAVSPTTVNDADMNNLCPCARQREKTAALGACVVLSAGCVLTDEVTPSSLIMQSLGRLRKSLSRSHWPPLCARVSEKGESRDERRSGIQDRVWECDTRIKLPSMWNTLFPLHLVIFPSSLPLASFPPPPLLMKLARYVSTLYVFWCPCLGSPSVEKQTRAHCLPLMFPAGRLYSMSIQQTNI